MNKKRLQPQKKEEKGPKKTLKELMMPELSVTMSSNIELLGNKEAIVEGCKGILEYDENTIRLNLGKQSVRFGGIDLTLKCMNSDNVIIHGVITTVEFM